MLKIIPKIFIIIFSSLLFSKEYLAIIDFSANNVPDSDVNALTQRLTSEMINLGAYQVIERSEMKKILDEQKFQHSGCVTTQCAVDIGKLLGAKYMVVGSISKVGSTYSADARIIDVESGEANISATYESMERIDNLLSSGMLEIAKQLSIENYIPSETKDTTNSSPLSVAETLLKNIVEDAVEKEKERSNKEEIPFDAYVWKKNKNKNKYYFTGFSYSLLPDIGKKGVVPHANVNDAVHISFLHYRHNTLQFKYASEWIDGYHIRNIVVPHIGGYLNIKKYNNIVSLGLNLWVTPVGEVVSKAREENCDVFMYETSLQLETRKLFSSGGRLIVGYRGGDDGENCNCFPENNGIFARIEMVIFSFGKNY